MQVALSCNLGTKLVHGYFISGKTNEQDRFLHCDLKNSSNRLNPEARILLFFTIAYF
jgi:hypothetical protein